VVIATCTAIAGTGQHASTAYGNPFLLRATGTCNNMTCNLTQLCIAKGGYYCQAACDCGQACAACS
jgi:hypothetical protein